ncbi:DUF1707 SHOCT-like domain-containing protein [Streptomyces violascens]|uniref:DUF1707 SHOCT-like domain-containing protein n=1 Tax=Streptomyces violascens TaxID=67381 RepID=UPI00364D337F
MNTPSNAELRISHEEREQSLEALTEHSRQGRLTIDEYGDRATALNNARTREDLLTLFRDLPEPRPHFTDGAAPVAVRSEPANLPETDRPQSVRHRLARASVPVGAVAAVGLTYLTGNWFFMFLTPPVTYAVESALRGSRARRQHEHPGQP